MSEIATPWVTLTEGAQRARVSTATLRRAARNGKLRAYKLNGSRAGVWRLRIADIDAFLEGRTEEPTPYDASNRRAEKSGGPR